LVITGSGSTPSTSSVASTTSGRPKLAAMSELSERTSRYIDQVVEGLIDIYGTERRRWSSRTGAARAAQIRAVLDNEGLGDSSAQELLGLPLDVWHQAAIVWVPAGTPDPGATLQAGNRLLNDISGRTPLTVLADDQTMWAWLSSPARPTLDGETTSGTGPSGSWAAWRPGTPPPPSCARPFRSTSSTAEASPRRPPACTCTRTTVHVTS
jgi:hypothetical protein